VVISKKTQDKEQEKRKVIFTPLGWEDYQYWSDNPSKNARVNELIKSAQVSLHTGIGKPEKLSGNLKGYYSRRIDQENRLVYKSVNGDLVIYMARFHY
jgi:toxin YoeB